MYIDKDCKRGYNEYLNLEKGPGQDGLMDVGLLCMEAGDVYTIEEPKKEVAVLMFNGDINLAWDDQSVDMFRPNPFDTNPWCLLVHKETKITITAKGTSDIYIQKTLNDKTEPEFPNRLFLPEETDTWARGTGGVLQGCIKRDVRTCFDLDNAPYSNMVLGEIINLPGKWTSYPPHYHPQPEVYFYRCDKPQGFGAGWGNGEMYETHHNGLALITEGIHPQVMAPGYTSCIAWGIRHFDDNPWDKDRIDDPTHDWLVKDDADDHIWKCPTGY